MFLSPVSLENSTKHIKKNEHQFHTIPPRKQEETFPNLLYEASITLILKS